MTRLGSPPKSAMYLWIQRRASRSEIGHQGILSANAYVGAPLTILKSKVPDLGVLHHSTRKEAVS